MECMNSFIDCTNLLINAYFIPQAGEVKFVRMAGEDSEAIRSAFIEFTEQTSVPTAFTYNNHVFAGRPLK